MLRQAIENAEEVARILDPDFWAARSLLDGSKKQLINKQSGVKSIRFANPEQARKIKELTMVEAGSKEVVKKVILDIDNYKASFNIMVIDGSESLRKADSLQSQVKAAKAQVNAMTKLPWEMAREAYDLSKKDMEEKKKDYFEKRDKRNFMLKVCTDIIDGIKAKKNEFHAELLRKAEEKRLAEEAEALRIETEKAQKIKDELRAKEIKEAEEKAALEAKKKLEEEKAAKEKERISKNVQEAEELMKPAIDTTATEVSNQGELCGTCGGDGEVMDDDGEFPQVIPCPACNVENHHTTPPPQATNKTTEPDATQPPQKDGVGQTDPMGEPMTELEFLNTDVWQAICGDSENFRVISVKIVDKWRHGTEEIAIVESFSSGKRYQSNFRDSVKDMDFSDMNGAEANFFEVEQPEKDMSSVEVDIKALALAVFQGMADERLLLPNGAMIIEILRDGGTVPGCKFKE